MAAIIAIIVLPCTVTGVAAAQPLCSGFRQNDCVPLVIAHRGASGHRPEHTLAAYRFALLQGADFIELDIVATLDGALIARHENVLARVRLDADHEIARQETGQPIVEFATTDVAQHSEFADRLSVKRIDGRWVGGWFSEDFTLAEVKTLWARERIPDQRPGNRLHDDRYRIPTLLEAIELVQMFELQTSRVAGLYIETKHPVYFSIQGRRLDGSPIAVNLGNRVLTELKASGFVDSDRVFIQSFEVAGLLALQRSPLQRELNLPLIQLFGDVSNSRYRAQPYDMVYFAGQGADLAEIYAGMGSLIEGGINEQTSFAELASPAVLDFMAAHYAVGIGPPKNNLLLAVQGQAQDPDGDSRLRQRAVLTGQTGRLLADARHAGLVVHPYTLRAEEVYLVRDGERVLSVEEEALALLRAGVQGFFIDQPSEGRAAVHAYLFERAGD